MFSYLFSFSYTLPLVAFFASSLMLTLWKNYSDELSHGHRRDKRGAGKIVSDGGNNGKDSFIKHKACCSKRREGKMLESVEAHQYEGGGWRRGVQGRHLLGNCGLSVVQGRGVFVCEFSSFGFYILLHFCTTRSLIPWISINLYSKFRFLSCKNSKSMSCWYDGAIWETDNIEIIKTTGLII